MWDQMVQPAVKPVLFGFPSLTSIRSRQSGGAKIAQGS